MSLHRQACDGNDYKLLHLDLQLRDQRGARMPQASAVMPRWLRRARIATIAIQIWALPPTVNRDDERDAPNGTLKPWLSSRLEHFAT